MSNKIEIIQSKIDLINDQIENLERSGFFTELEIQVMSKPILIELKGLELALSNEMRLINLIQPQNLLCA